MIPPPIARILIRAMDDPAKEAPAMMDLHSIRADLLACTCEFEEGGDAESGPRLYQTPVETCPEHGRAADPDGWAEADRQDIGYVMSNVVYLLRHREAPFSLAADEAHVMAMYDRALAKYDAAEDDGHNADRAITDVVDALIAGA